MISALSEISQDDPELAKLLEEARDFAHVYLLVKERQKGCDGMGEMATLRDDFKSLAERLVIYSKKRGYITNDIKYFPEEIIEELIRNKRA